MAASSHSLVTSPAPAPEFVYIEGIRYNLNDPDGEDGSWSEEEREQTLNSIRKRNNYHTFEKEQRKKHVEDAHVAYRDAMTNNKRQKITKMREITTVETNEAETLFPEGTTQEFICAGQPEQGNEADAEVTEKILKYKESLAAEHDSKPKDMDWADECLPSKTKPIMIPKTDPWYTELSKLREEGEPEVPVKCFGCRFEEHESSHVINASMWNNLINAFVKGLPNCGNICELGRELFIVFEKGVLVKYTAGTKYESQKLWTPYGLMYHFFYHNTIPQIRQSVLIARSQTLVNSIFENELYQTIADSGRVITSMDAIKKLTLAIELEFKLRRTDAEKLCFSTKKFGFDSSTSMSLLNSRTPVLSNAQNSSGYFGQKRWGN